MLRDAVAVVTGAASGIGRALAALGVPLDVTDETAVGDLVARLERDEGRIDLWCSNAGVDPGSPTVPGGVLEPAEVADAVVAALAEGRFLILPHPRVAEYERRRAADRDRWLAGMARTTERTMNPQ